MPRKLGQHFLVRAAILERLADAACGSFTPRVVEIGPGRGALTRHLLARTAELHAVELDRDLAAALSVEFAADTRFHLHAADVLTTDLSQWGPAVICGNLPYYITSPILERFVSLDARFPMAVFLMQKEVADRLLAEPGSRDYGFLTVRTRLFCDVELVCHVPPSAFSPPPKVDSSAVLLRRKPAPPPEAAALLAFAGRCFAHKRKTLRNNLRPFFPAAVLDALPQANLRAEQLSLAQFVELFHSLRA